MGLEANLNAESSETDPQHGFSFTVGLSSSPSEACISHSQSKGLVKEINFMLVWHLPPVSHQPRQLPPLRHTTFTKPLKTALVCKDRAAC